MNGTDDRGMSAWFAGPKAENGEWFVATIRRIIEDYYSWRRNYFPQDGVVVDSMLRRLNEPFQDAFEDRLLELLARLKADYPFYSPRYAAHMISEQTLPSIAGYIAAMLYNPNNVSSEAAPVTVRLELEASRMIAGMLGYGADCWAHLTGGGTIANIEAMWMARSVRYLPLVLRTMRASLGLAPLPWPGGTRELLRIGPDEALRALASTFDDARAASRDPAVHTRVIRAYLDSPLNVVERGIGAIMAETGSRPVLLVPESHHYCFEKALDLLGMGRRSLVSVAVGPDFRMNVDELARALDRVDADGDHVLAVVAVIGSTEEGAVDPLDQILELRAERARAGLGSFWVHGDAAYGGYLRTMTRPHRIGLGESSTQVKIAGRVQSLPLHLPEHSACAALERMGECDSITIDPHKLGFIPYPAGAICFKSDLVKPIARQDAPYFEAEAGDVETERASQSIGVYILEGSKPGAAAASVWLSHSLIPLDTTGHGMMMREMVRNACELHSLLEALSTPDRPVRAVCACAPSSNIVCYAFCPRGGGTLDRINALNNRIHARYRLEGESTAYDQPFFVSRTTLSRSRYSPAAVEGLLSRMGVAASEFERRGIVLLRSVLMNPWYNEAKRRGRYFLSELAEDLFATAAQEWAGLSKS